MNDKQLEKISGLKKTALSTALAAILSQPALGQEAQESQTVQTADNTVIEEVVAIGRLVSSSEEVLFERMTDAAVIDTIGAESISRLGDSTVAASLRRLPGLTLVQDKFVYIRGLGERYSSTSLNGAQIPSPDLTRNVIPLDVFPTSVVESLRVQKAWSADISANFGGGSVDIRTRGIPDALDINLEFSTGSNSETRGDVLTYNGGSDDSLGTDDGTRALPSSILSSINQYQGNIEVQSILASLRAEDPYAPIEEAQAINRALGLELNRDIGVYREDPSIDGGLKFSIGNRFDVGSEVQFGVLAGVSYDSTWRERISRSRNFNFPTEQLEIEEESTRSTNMATSLNLGLDFTMDHSFEFVSMRLRNTDDETAVRDFFNAARQVSDGFGFRDYRLEFEERNLTTNQIKGTHYIGADTRDRLPGLAEAITWLPQDTHIDWYYSESQAETDIPNNVLVDLSTLTNPMTGEVLSEVVDLNSSAAKYRFLDLDDEVNNFGWSIEAPFESGNSQIVLKFGGGWDQKARTYRETNLGLGALSVESQAVLTGPLNEVFSDANILNPENNFVFGRRGAENQSYIAATSTDALFGMVDWTVNDTWRVVAGARWEDYRQIAVDWNPYGYSATSPQVTTDADELASRAFSADDIYPAVSLTYMSDWWAETFQLRFGISDTSVRPDLREVTDASFIDPITGDVTSGNSGVVPSSVRNIDIRAEWFFSNGDNFTATLFRKNIDNPIELFEARASDVTIAREIHNAESATVEGVELEFLKELSFIGNRFSPFFVQGNLTLQDSTLVAGLQADPPTNPVRSLSGASDYVANLMLGYDSMNGKHTASIIFNEFGERLYTAGINPKPDAYEQPFTSVDLTYFWYPTDTLTFKAKMQNLLDESIEIERAGVIVFEESPGKSISLSVSWKL